jgi:hypothetical protein
MKFKFKRRLATYQEIMLATKPFSNVEYPYEFEYFICEPQLLCLDSLDEQGQSSLAMTGRTNYRLKN